MARSNLTTAARARGSALLEFRGAFPREQREARTRIAAGAIDDLLHALGPADALRALELALEAHLQHLRTAPLSARLSMPTSSRPALERLAAAVSATRQANDERRSSAAGGA